MKKKLPLLLCLLFPFVLFSQTLTSITPSSANAGQTLDITITATGIKFTEKGNLTLGIAGTYSNSVTVINDSTIKANISFPEKIFTGDYLFFVSAQTGMPLFGGRFYINGLPVPFLTSITPSVANAGQILEVILTGKNTHFTLAKKTAVAFINFFSNTFAHSITPINDTVLKAAFTIPGSVYDGHYDVTYYDSISEGITLPNSFQITGNLRQVIVGAVPNQTIAGRTLDVLITGRNTHFKTGKKMEVLLASPITVNTTTVLTDTTITANITIPISIMPANYAITVLDSANQYGQEASLRIFDANQPAILTVDPHKALTKQTLNVTITGHNTHFKSSQSTVLFDFATGTDYINSINPVNDSFIIANITIPYYVKPGHYQAKVVNAVDGALDYNNALFIEQSPPASLFSISPAKANADQTLDVTIKGLNTHFGPNDKTFFGLTHMPSIKINSVNVLDQTTLVANITIPESVKTGDYGFYVYDKDDGPEPIYGFGFHVTGVPPIQVNPNLIVVGRTGTINITGKGSHFNSPATKTIVNFIGNQPININSTTIVNDSLITLNITAPTIEGHYKIEVHDSIDSKMKAAFQVYPNCAASFKTRYDELSNIYTLTLDSITYRAVKFRWNFGDSATSTVQFPKHVYAKDTLYKVCLQIINIAGDSCTYCYEIGKDSLGNPISTKNGFSIQVIAPVIEGIAPTHKDKHFISVYPNPSDNHITISSSVSIHNLNSPIIYIYSMDGKLVWQQAFTKEEMDLDIGYLKKGIYILQLIGNKQTEIIKFVKE